MDRARGARAQFLADLRDARPRQERLVADLVAGNRDSLFGRDHRFEGIRSVADFASRVPVRRYEALGPWIKRAAAGMAGILTTAPVSVFLRGAGSEEGRVVPATAQLIEDRLAAHLAELGTLDAYHPEIFLRDDAVLDLDADPGGEPASVTRGGSPCLSWRRVLVQHGRGTPGSRAPWSRLPRASQEPERALYYRVRIALEHDVCALRADPPGALLLLADRLGAWAPRLADELRQGTVDGMPTRAPNPERAREIEALGASLAPRHLFPRLSLIVCGALPGGTRDARRLRELFGEEASIRTGRIEVCETTVAVPVDDEPAAPLFVPTVFYEFVPADEELGRERRTLLCDELEVGARYHLIVTQSGGLWRCAPGAIVRVVGRCFSVPRVELDSVG